MTDEEFAALREEMDEQREDVYEALAEDFGGSPEDYRVRDRSSTEKTDSDADAPADD
ncbi:hypothetical protein ACFO0N_21345 [Halobium salinum]|uniref:Uncharacterized protein n=1 Tax=Halobium salinum TaxID=1364940 RepID=A0ABD5PI03_9EURY|nr:hypothetical protein [Halobium salinum]